MLVAMAAGPSLAGLFGVWGLVIRAQLRGGGLIVSGDELRTKAEGAWLVLLDLRRGPLACPSSWFDGAALIANRPLAGSR